MYRVKLKEPKVFRANAICSGAFSSSVAVGDPGTGELGPRGVVWSSFLSLFFFPTRFNINVDFFGLAFLSSCEPSLRADNGVDVTGVDPGTEDAEDDPDPEPETAPVPLEDSKGR